MTSLTEKIDIKFPSRVVGWLNVWDADVEQVMEICEGKQPQPPWDPYFLVLRQDLKTLTCHKEEEGADDQPSLREVPTVRLDEGKREFDRRWGYEALESIKENAIQHHQSNTGGGERFDCGEDTEGSDQKEEGSEEAGSWDQSKQPYQHYADMESDDENESVDGAGKHLHIGETSTEDHLLYEGARLTVSVSTILIIAFSMRHSLSKEALNDLLHLMELHCPKENHFRGTYKSFQEFFVKTCDAISYQHYCKTCFYFYGKEKPMECTVCKKYDPSYFLTSSLQQQIASVLKGTSREIIQYRTKRSKHDERSIEDVFDGKLYKKHFNKDGYFHGTTLDCQNCELHLSLQLNTDGVAIFRSSNYSVWPLYAIINELPPSLRYSRENRIFCGLWFGKSKPIMKIFLKPFVEEMMTLYSKGEMMEVEENKKLIRVIALSSVADAPARCLLSDMVQFNGTYGCPCCYAPGETHVIGGQSETTHARRSHIYPYNTESGMAKSGHHQLRTQSEYVDIAKDVERRYRESRRAEPVPQSGIKGLSNLALLPKYDVIEGATVDYMHCVLLGIVKMLLNLWCDISHRNEKWSLRPHLKVLDKTMGLIKPPSYIHRMPQSFEDVSQWKASECRSFLLFFCIPVLRGYLPDEHFKHFILLSQATYIMLLQSISQRQLQKAKKMICLFALQIEELYGARYQTFNVHSLLHLCQKVEDLGPLWAHSCFFFEDLNGDMRMLFHGTSQVQDQVMMAVCIQQKMSHLQMLLKENMEAHKYYRSLSRRHVHAPFGDQISSQMFVVGCMDDHVILSQEKLRLIQAVIGQVHCLHVFYRVSLNNTIIQSKEYTRMKRCNSYTIQYGDRCYGFVQVFVKCLDTMGNVHYLALVNRLEKFAPEDSLLCNIIHINIHRKTKEFVVVHLTDVKGLCIYMEDPSGGFCYTSSAPNEVERE